MVAGGGIGYPPRDSATHFGTGQDYLRKSWLQTCFLVTLGTMKPTPKIRIAGPVVFKGLLLVTSLLVTSSLLAQETTDKAKSFESGANTALAAMKARAEELKINGVAVIAYAEGETVNAWSSKMVVVGTLKTPASEKDPGSNLLAIAYSKAAEMADTLKASGSGVRKPMKGEFGWQGGLVQRWRSGYLIAAFSGGKSEDDVKVSQAGLDVLAK